MQRVGEWGHDVNSVPDFIVFVAAELSSLLDQRVGDSLIPDDHLHGDAPRRKTRFIHWSDTVLSILESAMAKILLVIGDAAEVLDTFYPLHRLQEAGFAVDVAGPEARSYHLVLHERPPGWDITEERPGYHLQANVAFRNVNADEYAGLVISGGRAPEYLRYDSELLRLTRAFFASEKPVASVCHGIEIVAAAGGLEGGREATTVAKCALDITQFGGKYVDREVCVSGNLVTARTWHDNPVWMREFLRLLSMHSAG